MKKRISSHEPENKMECLIKDRSGMYLMDFLKEVGIPHKTWRRWVTGETTAKFTLEQIKKIANLLKFESFDELPNDFMEKSSNSND